MKVSKKEQRKECLERMKKLWLMDEVIRDFQNGQLYRSEICGILYYLTDEELKRVRNFENKHNAMVYHCIKNETEFGTLITYLYVSEHKEEWKMDREDMKQGIIFAYVDNLTCSTDSEFGSIGFASRYGGLVRTA